MQQPVNTFQWDFKNFPVGNFPVILIVVVLTILLLVMIVTGQLPAAQAAGNPGLLQYAAAQLQRRREGPKEAGR